MTVSVEAQPAPAKAMTVSIEAQPAPAKATAVSDDRPSWPTRPDCGARGRRQDPAGLRADAQAHVSAPGAAGVECAGGNCRGAGGRWRGLARQHTDTPTDWRPPRGLRGLAGLRADAPSQPTAHQTPLVWRAPEGPEGTGGLRGAAPNAVRPPSLAGGRARRRPEHQRGHKQPGPAGKARRSSPSEPCAQAGASHPGQSGCGPRCAAPHLRCR